MVTKPTNKYKEMFKSIPGVSLASEIQNNLKPQHELYEKIQYYLEKRAVTTRRKKRNSRNFIQGTNFLTIDLPRPMTEGGIGSKITTFFTQK
jgi:hypothetical protein